MPAATAEKSSSKAKAPKVTAVEVEEDEQDEREPVIIPAIKTAASATGRGLHVAGAVVSDLNLRKAGRGLKALGRRIPKVRFEKRSKDS